MTQIDELRGQLLVVNNAKVDAFKKEFNAIMRSKGWARGARTASALYTITYWQADAVPKRFQGANIRRLSISGWHGTGTRGTCRWFGDSKSFFDLYDSASPSHKAVVSTKRDLSDNSMTLLQSCVEQDKAMAAALEYARKV